MFQSNTSHTISMLVDQVLTTERRFNREYLENGCLRSSNGMLVELAMSVEDRNAEKLDEELKRFYYVVFCGNVSVFIARQDVPGEQGLRHFTKIPSDEWENTSNHDSCWRSDGLHFITDAYFEMCKECNDNVAPITLESICQIGFIRLWRDVEVITKSSDDDDYRNVLVSVKDI